MNCFACAAEIKSGAITLCSGCGLASYCGVECQQKGRQLFEHDQYCSRLSAQKLHLAASKMGVILYHYEENGRDSDNDYYYCWFADFMMAGVRELRWRPALILSLDLDDFAFFDAVYTTLRTFIRDEMQEKVEEDHYGLEEEQKYFQSVAIYATNMLKEDDGRFPAGFSYTYLLEQMWYTLSDFGLNIYTAYSAKLKRESEAKKRKAEEPLLDLARHEREEREHKRRRIDAELREAVVADVPIPMDMYLQIIAKQLPARDAIRLVLQTNKELRHAAADFVPGIRRELEEALKRGDISPKSKAFAIDRERRAAAFIEDMLLWRDFLEPMEEMLRTMTEEQEKAVTHLKELSALLHLPKESSTFLIWFYGNRYNTMPNLTKEFLQKNIDGPKLQPLLRASPLIASYYKTVADAMLSLPPDKNISCKSSIYFTGANGLRFSLNPDDDWALTYCHQFKLDQAPSSDSSHPWLQQLIELNQKIRSTGYASQQHVSITRFLDYILRAIDPTLTAYYILAQHPNILGQRNVQVPVPSSVLHGRDSFQTVNLAASSLRYGLRYRVFFDPGLPLKSTNLTGNVRRLTEEPFTIFKE
jgi:hypothetical protein